MSNLTQGAYEYKAVDAFNPNALTAEVNLWLERGWKLYGDPVVFGEQIVQPMVRLTDV